MADVMVRDAKGDATKALAQWKQKQHIAHEGEGRRKGQERKEGREGKTQ
jgi:hypothetical protein